MILVRDYPYTTTIRTSTEDIWFSLSQQKYGLYISFNSVCNYLLLVHFRCSSLILNLHCFNSGPNDKILIKGPGGRSSVSSDRLGEPHEVSLSNVSSYNLVY